MSAVIVDPGQSYSSVDIKTKQPGSCTSDSELVVGFVCFADGWPCNA